jgi:hypothetical protein
LSAVYFLFAAGVCVPAYSKKIADFIPANTTTSFNITFNSIQNYGFGDAVGDRFAIVALYDAGGVSLGFGPDQAASILGQSPAPDFQGGWTHGYGPGGGYHGGVAESAVASALEAGTYNGGTLDDSSSGGLLIDPDAGLFWWDAHPGGYYPQISTDPLAPANFTLVNFSGASAGGSGFAVEVVPEPTSFATLTTGAILLLFSRAFRRGDKI